MGDGGGERDDVGFGVEDFNHEWARIGTNGEGRGARMKDE